MSRTLIGLNIKYVNVGLASGEKYAECLVAFIPLFHVE
jgi:hypothetical protein